MKAGEICVVPAIGPLSFLELDGGEVVEAIEQGWKDGSVRVRSIFIPEGEGPNQYQVSKPTDLEVFQLPAGTRVEFLCPVADHQAVEALMDQLRQQPGLLVTYAGLK
ncbi:hypothetical protein A2160_01730 [Candidatus Beckwithbacteria bacterium RBG_13_42_9]|uniref:Uncharacterized protein n=1 Tax=Candidatus Beckwithbacteria bacterium RBG_13_42_9 TaxID=1797457 RepID=A0A1F5E3N1_9BACT|nr:MAG: hypothetical protein A2160_01730 [Candidatus Beckwithbacteria bacterium RBG_13_42_9]